MIDKKIICYFHGDPDGVVSATIVKKFYGSENVECIKCDYNNIPDISFNYKQCIIVDFCFDKDIMNKLTNIYGYNLIWIDHHISAKEKCPTLWKTLKGLRSIKNSGCMLTWKHFYPQIATPLVVEYVEDMDLWKWKWKSQSEPFNQAFFLRHKTPDDVVVGLLGTNLTIYQYIKDYIKDGNIMLEMQKSQVETSFDKGFDIIWEGYKTRLINVSKNQSQIGEYSYKNHLYPITLMWWIDKDKVVVGLRSDTIDVGKLAVKHKGGGHKFASGYVTNLDEIKKLYKIKG